MDINELIIKEVKKYEALYNTESEDYNEIRLKDEMWKLVAKKVGKSIDVVKEIWRDLRDTYKIYKNNEDMPSGSSQTNSSSFRYAESLSFLDKYLNTQASKHRSDNKHSTSKKRKSEEASHSLPVTNNINKSNDSNNHNTHMSTAKRSREDLSVSDISNVNNSGHDSNHNTRKPPEKFITKHSQDFIIEIIEILKNETAIWQTDSEKFYDPNEKQKSWERVLAKYKEFDKNATTEKVKKKYYGIRRGYRRELEKIHTNEKSTLWYFKHLDFLRTYIIDSLQGESEEEESVSSTTVNHRQKSSLIPNKDAADIYGESWAVTYRKLKSNQRIFAKYLIDEILMFAELGKLTLDNSNIIHQYIKNATPIQHHAPTHESSTYRRSGSGYRDRSPNRNWRCHYHYNYGKHARKCVQGCVFWNEN